MDSMPRQAEYPPEADTCGVRSIHRLPRSCATCYIQGEIPTFLVFFLVAMLDFELERCSRRCTASGRELRPGESYYSTLRSTADGLVREDYSLEAWQQPPENTVSWWRATIPDVNSAKRVWAPNEVMLHVLETKLADPRAHDFCFVLALLLIRRKVLSLATEEKDSAGRETMVVFVPKTELEYRVPVVRPTAARIQEIETELASMLSNGTEQFGA